MSCLTHLLFKELLRRRYPVRYAGDEAGVWVGDSRRCVELRVGGDGAVECYSALTTSSVDNRNGLVQEGFFRKRMWEADTEVATIVTWVESEWARLGTRSLEKKG